MEKNKRLRTPLRVSITRTLATIETELRKDDPDIDVLENCSEKLQEVKLKISTLDEKIMEELIDNEATDDEVSAESFSAESYTDKIRTAMRKVNNAVIASRQQCVPASVDSSGTENSQVNHRKTYKLPKIEIKKFNGELLEWLSFWSQFQKIHNDPDLHDADKFQYLFQSMSEGTRAYELVSSFPQCADNYNKVIAALQERFGKRKLLKQVYVREMLKMVVNNAKNRDVVSLSKLYDKLESHLRALETLGITSEQTAEFLYPMVESSLAEDILIAWQRSANYGKDGSRENPPLNEMDYLLQFLRGEVESEEQRFLARNSFTDTTDKRKFKQRDKRNFDTPTAYGLVASQITGCIFCKKSHASQDCFKAQNLTLAERKEKIKEGNYCFSCLKPNHTAKNCRSFVKCVVCGRKHYALLCNEIGTKDKKEESKSIAITEDNVQTTLTSQICSSDILLMTCLVKVKGSQGEARICRVLFDSGSHLTRIKSNIVKSLGLQPIEEKHLRTAVYGGDIIAGPHSLFNLQIESLDGKVKRCLKAYDEKMLCGALLPRIPNGPWLQEMYSKGIRFNDLESNNKDIDLILGSEYFQHMLTGKRVESRYGYYAIETIFGWTLSGALNKESYNGKQNMAMVVTSLYVNEADITQLWKLDAIGINDSIEVKSKAERELQVTENFIKTLKRKEDGRYIVRLPWKEEGLIPLNNRSVVEKRLNNITIKLEKSGHLFAYNHIFSEWLQEEFIESALVEQDKIIHYLPHHPVFKPDSVTTPVRPVFDASCRIGKGPSLNDCLEKGPNYIELLPPLLLRFRKKRFGITADIRKAFQMIEVNENDRNALCFLWWKDPMQDKQLITYRHKRVVFGVNCSPFILGAVLNYHFKNVCIQDKSYAEKLIKSMYVDNCVTSLDSVEEYLNFKEQATRILADCKMQLRQWECSYQVENLDYNNDTDNLREITNVLGLTWNKRNDTLSCNVAIDVLPEKITKRVILSVVQKIFDPLGIVCPVTLTPKLLLRQSWIQKKSWDEELSTEDSFKFRDWHKTISQLAKIEISRWVNYPIRDVSEGQLHIFCDASKEAYAAVVFLRIRSVSGISVHLLQAKSRIAPMKITPIPRLELLACTIAARLGSSVKLAYEEDLPCFYWTDSIVALAWIQRENIWGTFVGNRVREINSLTDKLNWRHVPGDLNPADLPSRGCTALQLKESKWWEGPQWLKDLHILKFDVHDNVDEEQVQKERKKVLVLNLISTKCEEKWYCKRSSYTKNIRIMAYVLRFIGLLRKQSYSKREISVSDLNEAEIRIFILVQRENFPNKGDVISGFKIVRDEDGLIRIATKLTLSDDDKDFRYPILLPYSHPLTEQLIRHEHLLNCHAGVQFLMSKIRERHWILKGRKAIRKVIQNCVPCKRHTSKKISAPEPPLPKDRVHRTAPFDVTGVDLAGPLQLKHNEKAWIIIFTCAVYRCIHLELANSLSTDTFLLAFYRFVSRRRRPSVIYSDNGTNFTAASKMFLRLDWKRIVRDSDVRRIHWKFNPPSAAWWGGWWERLIGLVKSLLRRMLGYSKLTYIQLETCICEVEAVINNRPLTYVSEDPHDLIPLTPAKFLGEMAESVGCPEEAALNATSLRRKYKEFVKLRSELRNRFKKEYLALLVQRGSEKHYRRLRVGDVVLIASDNEKRISWPLAIILELKPGRDGCERVAKLRTSSGIYVRPVQRLYPLEISDEKDLDIEKTDFKNLKDNNLTLETNYVTRSGREVKIPKRYPL